MQRAIYSEQQTASSGQRTTSAQQSSMRVALYSRTSAQHGTDDTHRMQHCTIPPLPQQAPNTNGTDNTQQAMQCNEMRRTKSGHSRISGHAAPAAVVESDGVLDSDCRRVTVTVESCNSQNWAFGYGGTDSAKSDVPNSQDQSGSRERETEASDTPGSRRSEGA